MSKGTLEDSAGRFMWSAGQIEVAETEKPGDLKEEEQPDESES